MEDDMKIYADDIDLALDEYVESRNIEDERKMTSSMWAAAMQYIGNKVFKNRDDLLRQRNTWNNEPYDLDKVLALVNKYIFLCNDHNQRVCVEHFSMLSGIHKSTISLWANDLRRSGDKKAKQIYLILMDGSMQAADDLMVSKTGVNTIAYRNATKERYDAVMSKQAENNVLDMDSLADRLGISADLQALQDKAKLIETLGIGDDLDNI